MHRTRFLVPALLVALVLIVAPPAAHAQTGMPDIVGHGSCLQSLGGEPQLGSVSIDSIVMERAGRLIAAVRHWGSAVTHTPSLAVIRPTALRSRAGRVR